MEWPRRAFGGTGPGQIVPGLPQYWHPHLLGGRVTGSGWDGAVVYAEKNWGPRFTEHWWWGQAQAFEGADACVAFAGGRVLGGAPTGVVVRVEDRVLRLSPPFARVVSAVGEAGWRVRARSARWSVEIEAEGVGAPAVLPVPVPGERRVEPRSQQYLTSRLHATVRRGNRVWWTRRIHPRRPRTLALGPLGAFRCDGQRLSADQPLERADHGPQRLHPQARRGIHRIDPGLGNQRRAAVRRPARSSARTAPAPSRARPRCGSRPAR